MSFSDIQGDARAVAVVRHDDPEAAYEIAKATAEGGITLLEITMTVPGAPEVIARLAAENPAWVLGAGTVLDAKQAEACAEAGARFLVSPCIVPEVLAAGAGASVAVVPGIYTPTEAFTAYTMGAPTVKLFPAAGHVPAFIKQVREVLPVAIMPTGGITVENAAAWLSAGACAVGVGSALNKAYAKDGASGVTAFARELTEAISAR